MKAFERQKMKDERQQRMKAGKWFFLLALILLGGRSYGQATLLVESVRTQNFPELRFELRSSENLVAGKAALVVKDNYVGVPRFKITAGKANASGTGFVVSYTVLDPDRLDGTTTFEYRGQSVTTTYLIKKPTEQQAQAYPKVEHSDNRIFYIIGGLGLLAGVAGFVLARRKAKPRAGAVPAVAPPPMSVPVQNAPLPPVIPPPYASPAQPAALPAMPPPQERSAYEEDAYKPRPQQPGFSPPPPAPMTQIRTPGQEAPHLPALLPRLELRLGDRRATLALTGVRQVIGRAPECNLLVQHPTVSKIHAAVWLQDGTWWMEDLGSTNGTYVDGQRISRTALHSGSKVHFGQVAGVFQMPDYREERSERNGDR